jgi:GNAT superfamily N-acetyltransferase
LALRSKAHWGYDDAFMAACRDELTLTAGDLRRRSVHVAEADGGALLGFYALETGDGTEGELWALFVEPSVIGSGVGTVLLDHARGAARALGLMALRIDADPHAVGFYERRGAQPVGSTPSASIPGRRLPRYRLTVGPS